MAQTEVHVLEDTSTRDRALACRGAGAGGTRAAGRLAHGTTSIFIVPSSCSTRAVPELATDPSLAPLAGESRPGRARPCLA